MAEDSRLGTISVHLGPLFFALAEDHVQVAESVLTVWIGRIIFIFFLLLLTEVFNHRTKNITRAGFYDVNKL